MLQKIQQQSKPQELEEIVFTQETIQALTELGLVLERVYRRMKSEGYDIINDKIIHLATGEEYDPTKRTTK